MVAKRNREDEDKILSETTVDPRDAEIIRLKQQLAESQAQFQRVAPDHIQNEIKQIQAKGKLTANVIQYKEISDHVPVALYTQEGKRIGPLHPDNAVDTLQRFAAIGVKLTTKKPTDQEVEAYKATPAYQAKHKEWLRKRALKEKSRKPDAINRLIETMNKVYGLKQGDIFSVKGPGEVVSTKEHLVGASA